MHRRLLVQFSKPHSIEIYFIFVLFNLDTKWDWRTMKKLWLALIKWKKTNNASKRSTASKQLRRYSVQRTLCGIKSLRNPECQTKATKVPMRWPRTNHRQVSASLIVICRLPWKIYRENKLFFLAFQFSFIKFNWNGRRQIHQRGSIKRLLWFHHHRRFL